jgi:GNAT superfamily N-acetyltransferase
MVAVRQAGLADASALSALSERARADLSAHRGGAALLLDPVLAGALSEDAQHPQVAFVADEGGLLLGGAAGWLHGEVGWFIVWVRPEARRHQHGSALAEAVTGWLRVNGARSLDSLSLPGDRATKQLLEKLGYKARLLVMREGG